MKGHFSAVQSLQWAVAPMEEEEEEKKRRGLVYFLPCLSKSYIFYQENSSSRKCPYLTALCVSYGTRLLMM
jgi:hypothetical protein